MVKLKLLCLLFYFFKIHPPSSTGRTGHLILTLDGSNNAVWREKQILRLTMTTNFEGEFSLLMPYAS
jgi:hypothetical protein